MPHALRLRPRGSVLLPWLVFGLLLVVGSANLVGAADARLVRFDLTVDDYKQFYEDNRAAGYLPISVSSYVRRGELRYAVVLDRPAVPFPWAERHDLSLEEFQDHFDALLAQGLRPISLSVTNVGPDARFSGIWGKIADVPWRVRVGINAAEFPILSEEYREQKLAPAVISGYELAGQSRFAVLWLPENEDTRTILDQSPTQFQETSRKLEKDSWQPIVVQPYVVAQNTRVATVWVKAPAGSIQNRMLASTGEFNDLVDTLPKQGFLLRSVAGLSVRNETRLTATWVKLATPR